MYTAFGIDLSVLLLVEIGNAIRDRSAIEQLVEMLGEGGELVAWIHIASSIIFTICYIVAIVTGRRLHRTGKGRRAHKLNAAVFLVTRATGYITSFWMMG